MICDFPQRGHNLQTEICNSPLFLLKYMNICGNVCGCVHISAVPTEARRGCQSSCNWSSRWLWSLPHGCWELKPFSGRTANVLAAEASLQLHSPPPPLHPGALILTLMKLRADSSWKSCTAVTPWKHSLPKARPSQ